MRLFLPCLLTCLLLHGITSISQSQPVMTDTAIHVTSLMNVKPNAVRLARNPVNNALYYATYEGKLFRILNSGGVMYDTLIATAAHHYINYLQCIIFKDSNIYLAGNHKFTGNPGYGLIMRGKLQSSGSFLWNTLMHTATYPSAATLYDHAFSSVCLSPGGDSLYFSSGSRTDHGEVQTAYGLFPNKREVGLTATIFRMPVNPPATIYLPNDSAALLASGYVYCRGVRNSFDLELAPNGDLFGCENSGDRDDPEELNWLKPGNHYGFPWRMGGNLTGQQFAGYNANNDVLINDSCGAWKKNYFYNDPAYPQSTGITFTEPVKNYGPDADKFRDPVTGTIKDASDLGTYITSFTSHRSPLGLVFDAAGKLAAPYYHSAFMMSYQEGTTDSAGVVGNGVGPFCDTGQDLLQLALFKDTVTGQYSMNCYRLGWTFKNAVDAYLDNNTLYVIESHINDAVPKAKLYAITFPLNSSSNSCPFLGSDKIICKGKSVTLTPNLKGQFNYLWSTGATTSQITVMPATTVSYWVRADNGILTSTDTITVVVKPLPVATITPTGPTTFCSGNNPLTLTANTGTGFTYKWKKGTAYVAAATAPVFIPTATATYKVEVTNTNGCSRLSTGIKVMVNALPAATITAAGATTFCTGDSVVLQANTGTGLTYQWKKGTALISGATNANYAAKTAGTYKLIVTNVNNCSKTSAGKTVTVNCREGESVIADNTLKILPNPTDGLIILKFNAASDSKAILKILNTLGETVFVQEFTVAAGENNKEIKLENVPFGIYFIDLKTEHGVMRSKLIKE